MKRKIFQYCTLTKSQFPPVGAAVLLIHFVEVESLTICKSILQKSKNAIRRNEKC